MPSGKFIIGSMAQYVVRNPFTTAAAVFSPLFAKNEDRGYFRTALITTPIVFATGAAVPKLFGGVRDLARVAVDTKNLLQKSEKWTRFEQVNFNDLKTLFKDPTVSENTIERALSSYLISERKSRDFLKEQKSLSKYFNRRFAKTSDLVGKSAMGDLEALARIQEIDTLHATKGRLITNAMHVARRSSLTPLEWSAEPTGMLPEIAGADINNFLISTFEQYKDRPEFVKTLKNRLREIKNLDYAGTSAVAAPALPVSTLQSTLDFEFDDAAAIAFKKQSPGAFEALARAQKLGSIADVTIEAERVVSGDIGRVLNVKVNRRGNLKPLQIPIVDPMSGSVRLGGNAIGVGNYVIGPDNQPYRIDEWVSKMLAEQPKFTFDQLQEEINAHAYWFAGDPMDSRRMSELASYGDEGAHILNAQAIKLRSYGAGITKLPLFETSKGYQSFYDYDFDPGRKVQHIKDLLNTNRFINMGSEAGVYEGRFQLREAANLSPFGAPSASKQDPIWRSITKEFRLTAPEGLPPEGRLTWGSTAWETLTGTSELPAAKFTLAGLSPQDRTLFSELPRTAEELASNREAIIQKFMGRGMSSEQAAGMFGDISNLYASGGQGVLGYLGGMGETGFVLDPNFSNNFQVEGISKYNVDELGVKAGDIVEKNNVLGFNRGERVLPRFTGTVTDVARSTDGFVVNIKHELSMQGAKLDIAGIKGMARVTDTNEHFGQLRDLMNNFYERLGTGDRISDEVNALVPAEYFTNKVEPAHAYLGIGSDIVNRLDAAGAGDVASSYLQQMAYEGVNFNNGQFIIDATKNPLRKEEQARRLLRLSEINEQFFAQAGEAIRQAGGYQDPVLNAFVLSGKDLGNFMLKNQLPAMGFAWDHSLSNVPRFSSISYDVETYMALGGNLRGLKAMRNRLQTVSGGNAAQSLDFMKYLMSGDFSKEMGTTIPIGQAFQATGSLTDAGNRAGSIFDPSIEAYKKNFRLDLGNGRFLPVPGTEAYGAEGVLFEPGKYQTRPWQHALQDLAFAKSPEQALEIEDRVIDEYKKQFGVGKGSALRPYQYDPLGVPGFLSTAAEQGDPFVARVSEQFVERIHSKRLRKALMAGEDVVGMIQRQPTNDLYYMKYRVDPALNGTFDVAVPESVSRALMGDQDKDLINNILFDANIRMEGNKAVVANAANQMEREAAEEALEMMNGPQQRRMSIAQGIKGTDEIAMMNKDFELAGLSSKTEKFANEVSSRVGVAVNRTAGASIGAYSNALTTFTEQMMRSPGLMRDPDLVQRLSTAMFDIRQAPISARKAHTAFSLETALNMIDRLNRSIQHENPTAAADGLHSTLLTMSKTLSPMGGEGPEYKYWATQGAEDLQAWARARSEKAALMSQAFTLRPPKDTFEGTRAQRVLGEAFKDIESTIGAVHGGRMSNETATRLGMTSEFLGDIGRDATRSVTGKLGKIFAEHGGSMALGVGALAALGVALTPNLAPVASFSRGSGNKFRPEERMGVADSIPSEPVPGQMAPSAPPRRVAAAKQGVRKSVIASMNQTSDLYVRMKAKDQDRAADTSRMLASIPTSGDSNVTINYRDKTNLRSLRTKERIREINS